MKIKWEGPIFKKSDPDRKAFAWPSSKGVYVIANFDGTDIIARYVGKGDINQRIADHKDSTEECMEKALDDNRKIYYSVIGSETDRSNIEHTLYHRYGGMEDKLCNDQEPEGNLIDVNGPPDVIAPY